MPTAPVELLGANHFEAFAVDIDDLDGIIRFQMPAQLGDINIHRASVEIVWISPNALQSKGALEQSIFMLFSGSAADLRKIAWMRSSNSSMLNGLVM